MKSWIAFSILAAATLAAAQSPAAPQPVIMVLPNTDKGVSPLEVLKTNPHARQVQAAINSYLTSQKFDVVFLDRVAELSKQVDVVSGVRGHDADPIQQIAQATGADLYIAFEGEVSTGAAGSMAALVLNAYETTTGRLLGTTSTPGDWKGSGGLVAVDGAARDSVGQLLGKVKSYWADDAVKGAQYKVVLQFDKGIGDEQRTEVTDALSDVLEQSFPANTEISRTPSAAEYQIWAPRDKFSNSTKVSQVFRRKLALPDVKVVEAMANRKLLILEVKPK